MGPAAASATVTSRWSTRQKQPESSVHNNTVPVMDDTSVLIVVSVLQGRNFDLFATGQQSQDETATCAPPEVIFQARFLGEELLSDPIALTTSDPAACTELGWEVTRRAVHQFRVERKPIKLQAFVMDAVSREKTLIGYWIFDIRSAQESADPKFEWKPLLNPKFRGNSKQRPEILCALQLIKSYPGEAAADESSVAESPKSLTSISDPSLLENDIQVRQENGLFRIWDSRLTCEGDCEQMYRFTIQFSSVTGLQQLMLENITSNNNNGDSRSLFLRFQLSLFGKEFTSQGFECPISSTRIGVDEEVIHILLAVESAHTIRAYFQLYPLIDVCLLYSDQILASATIPLTKVFADSTFKSMTGDFRLLRTDESDTSEPHPSVGVRVSVTPCRGSDVAHNQKRSLRHFRFSMDIRCLQPIALSPGSFFIRYLYATFGSLGKVVTSAVDVATDLNALTFSDGYCAFNFMTTTDKLYETFSELPLVLELMEKKDRGGDLTAICKLDLRKLYECEEDMEGKKLLVMKPHLVDPQGETVAQVTVICCLRDMGAADASSLVYLNTSSDGKNADVFEQLYVTAAVELEVWKQQQKHKFQKKLLQSMKSQSQANGLEQELRDCLQRVKKREQELDDSKVQLDRLEEEYGLRTQKLGDEISQAVLQVQLMYESRIEKERQTIRNLEEQNKQLSAELASLKPKIRPTSRTQSLARVGSVSSNPVRSVSRSRAASVTSDLPKPLIRETGPKTSSITATRRLPQKAGPASNKLPADRKSSVLHDLKNERDSLLRNGLCRSDDPIIKTIETELRRNGVRTK